MKILHEVGGTKIITHHHKYLHSPVFLQFSAQLNHHRIFIINKFNKSNHHINFEGSPRMIRL